MNTECPICAKSLSRSAPVVGGWRMCGDHRVYQKPSRNAGRCTACGGAIAEGQPILLCKEGGRWTALHRAGSCAVAPWSVLHVTPAAPWEVIEAAYRALSLLHHPDRGGDGELMKQINNAMDELRGLRARRAAA